MFQNYLFQITTNKKTYELGKLDKAPVSQVPNIWQNFDNFWMWLYVR